jgi:hypothetical protein
MTDIGILFETVLRLGSEVTSDEWRHFIQDGHDYEVMTDLDILFRTVSRL